MMIIIMKKKKKEMVNTIRPVLNEMDVEGVSFRTPSAPEWVRAADLPPDVFRKNGTERCIHPNRRFINL